VNTIANAVAVAVAAVAKTTGSSVRVIDGAETG